MVLIHLIARAFSSDNYLDFLNHEPDTAGRFLEARNRYVWFGSTVRRSKT
jgi:hypothetical protein